MKINSNFPVHLDNMDFEEKIMRLFLFRRIERITKIDEKTVILSLDNGLEFIIEDEKED
jgi:hypothetical protein